MKEIHGDLLQLALEGQFDVIIHGCNCFCTMGAGIAKGVKKLFPEAYAADKATHKGDKDKLGTITTAYIQRDGLNLTVVNGYTQYRYFGVGRLVDYDAIRSVMQVVKKRFAGQRIGYPMIGAGLARGDWQIIWPIIAAELEGEDHTLVIYKPS